MGDVVQFHGGYHYVSSAASNPTGSKCAAGPAKITLIAKGAKHPWHLLMTHGQQHEGVRLGGRRDFQLEGGADMAEETEKTSIKQLFQGNGRERGGGFAGDCEVHKPAENPNRQRRKARSSGRTSPYVPWHSDGLRARRLRYTGGRRARAAAGGDACFRLPQPRHRGAQGHHGYTTRSRWGRKSTFWLSTRGSSTYVLDRVS